MKHPRLNLYRCGQGHQTCTLDVDEGTTPFMIDCQVPGCRHTAQSSFYPKFLPPQVAPKPSHEWYIPTKKETKRLNSAELEHVKAGGLLLRPRTTAEPRYEEV